jgi:nucleotide-binding universal stress UspA family protein
MQRGQGDELQLNGERRHDADGSVIVGVSSETPDLRLMLEFAADEANRRRVDLTLVHGCSPIPMPTTLEPTTPLVEREVQWIERLGMMAETATELLDLGRTADILVHRGTGVHALLEASASASLVVLQRRRISQGRRIRTGSTSALVAARSLAPVAILVASKASPPPSANVVVGVDVAAPSSALSEAFREAELRQTGLLVVHGWRPKRTSLFADGLDEEDEFRRQFSAAHQTLVEYVRPWATRYPQVPLRHKLFTLPPADSLLLAASEGQLLVLGRHQRGRLGTLGLGQIARRCLAEAPCPVLVTNESQRVERPGVYRSRARPASCHEPHRAHRK